MRIRTTPLLLVTTLAVVLASPVRAQQRTTTLATNNQNLGATPSEWLYPAARVRGIGSSAVVSSPAAIGADSAERRWWRRHPIKAGALGGMVAGLGAYYLLSRNDPYCRDPDMFPCEFAIPIFVAEGALAGGFVGWLASLPPRLRD